MHQPKLGAQELPIVKDLCAKAASDVMNSILTTCSLARDISGLAGVEVVLMTSARTLLSATAVSMRVNPETLSSPSASIDNIPQIAVDDLLLAGLAAIVPDSVLNPGAMVVSWFYRITGRWPENLPDRWIPK